MTVSLAIETRKMTPEEIARSIRLYREEYRWTQVDLAHEAHVEERTIQRAESGGKKVSDDTLRRIAQALKIDEPDFFIKKHRFKSPEQVEREWEEARRKFVSIPLTQITQGRKLLEVVAAGGDAGYFEVADDASDKNTELVATLFDHIKEYGEILPELSFQERAQALPSFEHYVKELDSEGLCLCVGTRRTTLVCSDRSASENNRKPFPFDFQIFIVSTKEFPKKFVLLDRQQPVRFR